MKRGREREMEGENKTKQGAGRGDCHREFKLDFEQRNNEIK